MSARNLALVSDEMLTTNAEEAALVGVVESSVSRARRDPNHPVNQPGALTIGSRKAVKAADVRAFWEKRWANATADDLARKRRRPAPAPVEGAKA